MSLQMGQPDEANCDNFEFLCDMESVSVHLICQDSPSNSDYNYAALIGSVAVGAAFKDTRTRNDVDQARPRS